MDTAANPLRTPDLPVEGPTYEDGNLPSSSASAPLSPDPQHTQEAPQPAEPPKWTDNKRSEIFARARETRLDQTEPFSGDPNDPDALYGPTTDASELGELEQEALRRRQQNLGQVAQQPQQTQGNAPKPLNGIDPQFLAQPVPIIVDGEERVVPIEELVRNYQIDQAAAKRLEQAKALLAQTQEFQRLQPQPGNRGAEYEEPSGQDDSTDDSETYGDDRGNTSRRSTSVKELVEKIQLGTPDEAAQALEEFVSSAVNRSAPVDETTRVLTALEDHNAKQAVVAFAEQNPQIATNPILQAEATRHIHRGMAEDLLRAGYTMDQLRQMAPGAKELAQLHKQARIQGVKGVRRVSELVSAGYQGALTQLRSLVETAAPAIAQNPAPSMAQRQQRKESLQPQPVARRLSPGMSAPSQQRSQEQSRQNAVARIRAARGQAT